MREGEADGDGHEENGPGGVMGGTVEGDETGYKFALTFTPTGTDAVDTCIGVAAGDGRTRDKRHPIWCVVHLVRACMPPLL